jgi:hypothetical protein
MRKSGSFSIVSAVASPLAVFSMFGLPMIARAAG